MLFSPRDVDRCRRIAWHMDGVASCVGCGSCRGVQGSEIMFKIYVGNLDYKVKLEQLRELFAVYAPIEDLVIPTDPKTNRAKGFAIVMIRDAELGEAAVKAMQGKRLMGRTLVVNQAVKKKKAVPAPTKSELVRNGPFGPRMNRFGDPRSQTGARPSRNPRRMMGGRPSSTGGGLPHAEGGSAPPPPGSSRTAGASSAPRPVIKPDPGAPPAPSASRISKPGDPLRRPSPGGTASGVPLSNAAAEPQPGPSSTSGPQATGAPPRPAPAAGGPPSVQPEASSPARPKAQKLAAPKKSADGGQPS